MNKKILFILIVVSLFFISSCKINTQDKETYITAKCEDGFEYDEKICVNGKCDYIAYVKDPCLGHYLPECKSDSDCSVAGCSGQICTTKEKAFDLITTCEYLDKYQCLKLTSCSCIQGKCAFDENNEYLSCLSTYN